MSEFCRLLQEGAQAMGLELSAAAAEQMEAFHRLLTEKNKVMNLTAVTEDVEAVPRHYLDSLAPLSLHLIGPGQKVVDVGTGAGFPGVPLLIAGEKLSFTFVDSLNKRLDFLSSALEALGLSAELVHARAEDFGRKRREEFDLATARAVASLPTLCEYLLPPLKLGGSALCWKGPGVENENAQNALKLLGGGAQTLHPYSIPGRDFQHLLVRIQKQAPTPARFPRKSGLPQKSPL